ncbi:hypothetical protein IRJ41_000265 [Triplophysa rosa]|uniref:Uncharacterized protein n=1 Tax=Triplophysa rosa TaxID=992332 RepID=A0A9W8CBV1_TRIRA|nr:hypothetical protein IRJ41_000265 [Triplophysa rosa]
MSPLDHYRGRRPTQSTRHRAVAVRSRVGLPIKPDLNALTYDPLGRHSIMNLMDHHSMEDGGSVTHMAAFVVHRDCTFHLGDVDISHIAALPSREVTAPEPIRQERAANGIFHVFVSSLCTSRSASTAVISASPRLGLRPGAGAPRIRCQEVAVLRYDGKFVPIPLSGSAHYGTVHRHPSGTSQAFTIIHQGCSLTVLRSEDLRVEVLIKGMMTSCSKHVVQWGGHVSVMQALICSSVKDAE